MYYLLESTAERRKRKYQDIKTLFQQLTVEEGFHLWMPTKLSGISFMNRQPQSGAFWRPVIKSAQIEHNTSTEKQ